jgi:beta-mannosidase
MQPCNNPQECRIPVYTRALKALQIEGRDLMYANIPNTIHSALAYKMTHTDDLTRSSHCGTVLCRDLRVPAKAARRFWLRLFALLCTAVLPIDHCLAQQVEQTVTGWQMQDAAKAPEDGRAISQPGYSPKDWFVATVPGTVLTTLVNNKVYPEPLYGENMRGIPESLNKAEYWYRASFKAPMVQSHGHIWLHFAGINYSAEVWVNGIHVGAIRGAFIRGDFDITDAVKPGHSATVAVLIRPQPHPGVPHEHTVAQGIGKNGGASALDGPTFLSTVGWDWLSAVRDRDTGIWLPVTVSTSGSVILRDPYVTSVLSEHHDSADLRIATTVENLSPQVMDGFLEGEISGQDKTIVFRMPIQVDGNGKLDLVLSSQTTPELHFDHPLLWWPNGYGEPNLYKLTLRFMSEKALSDQQQLNFGIRKIDYSVAGSDNLVFVVNGVKIMIRGGDWGLDEAMKRIPRKRLDAQFHMHALAHLNMIRNWVGQSTSPDFYDLADKYGILLWDEFFQPNPGDGPEVADVRTYIANVTDKVKRYRNHPSIAVWCARNEGLPSKEIDDSLKSLMSELDPTRLYQSSSADGRGVSSHGPYYWRAPRFFYALNESFKTETGSVSVPTIESIQGRMPSKDWESINDDWAQHDMAFGAQRGNEYPHTLAWRYGRIRNLADFVRKAQLANYEAFRAIFEGRNAKMFTETTGVLTWMSHPAQPSFVWQLYHYDLEPNASLFAAMKGSEQLHVQLNEANRDVEVVNNRPNALSDALVRVTIYSFDGRIDSQKRYPVANVPESSVLRILTLNVSSRITPLYFIKLDLLDHQRTLLSTNLYWQHVAQDEYEGLASLPKVVLDVSATPRVEGENSFFDVTVSNPTATIALMAHLQLRRKTSGERVLPVFYSDNYLSLAPGESRVLTIEAATADVADGAAISLDGFNVDVKPVSGPIPIFLNENAQPMHWPASEIVSEDLP